jgi:TRAP-type C4-dicarboxylate transport system permease small subunit
MNKFIESLCGALAGIALFGIMALTFFDVAGRKIVSQSITGSLEMTELLMVVVIFAALPLVSLKGEHVVFDSLDNHIPPTLRRIQHSLVHVLCAGGLLALGWLMIQTGKDFSANGDTTAQLAIPKAPFIYGMGVLCALTGLVHLALAFKPAASPGNTSSDNTPNEFEGGTL